MRKWFAAIALCGTEVNGQDLDPPLGNLFAPCQMGLGALYQLEDEGSEASLEVSILCGAVRMYLIGLAHGKYGGADPDGYAKVYYHFIDECSKDSSLRIEAIGKEFQ